MYTYRHPTFTGGYPFGIAIFDHFGDRLNELSILVNVKARLLHMYLSMCSTKIQGAVGPEKWTNVQNCPK